MSGRLSIWGFSAGWRLVRLLPERLAYGFFSLVAQFVWWRQGRAVRQLEANLARVVPTASGRKLKSLTRRAVHSYMRYYCDAFRLPDWSDERILSTCRTISDEAMRDALAHGKGVLVALGHSGNWDHAGAWSTLAVAPVTTVAERLEPEEVFQRFLNFRQQLGMEILPLSGGGEVFSTLVRRLRKGGLVPLLADRDLSATGVPVTFFGESARMAAGPASLALVTGCSLFPATIYYERLPKTAPARWGIVIELMDEIKPPAHGQRSEHISAMTQQLADALARGIAAHPHDWHMMQKIFLADLMSASESQA